MKHIRNIAIVAVLVVAVGVVVAIKQGKRAPEPFTFSDNVTVAGVGLSPVALGAKGDDPGVSPASTKPATAALPKLVDLGATKCIPCKMMAPILEDLKKTYAGKLDVQFIDVWENPDAGKQYGINVIPTQIFYDAAGKELFRHEGFFAREDILAKWKELGVDLK